MTSTSQRRIRVLHVDDDPDFSELVRTVLEQADDKLTVETATSADQGLEMIGDRPPDCVVSDYNMPGTDGIEFLQAVRNEHPDLPFILFTGKGSEAVASDALRAGATDYIQKQSGAEQYELLANRVENAVTQYWSERRLRETRNEYTAVFENAQNALILVQVEDDGFRYQQCNPRAMELIGRDRAEIVGNTPREALGPENGTKVVGAYRACVERREPVAYTVTLDLPVGEVIRECEVAPVSSDGEIKQLVVEFRDITEQRRRQQELEEYGTIIEALTDAVYVLDETGRFTYVNDEFVELVGYDRETILGSLPSLIKDPEAVEQAEAQLGQLLSNDGRDTLTFEVTVHPSDGDPIVCEDQMGVLPYEGDQFDGSVGTLRDITDHKERERKLARTHGFMTNIEQWADVGAWGYDPDTEALVLTDGARRIFGLEPDVDLTVAEVFECFHPEDRNRLVDRFTECLETGTPYEVELRLTTTGGAQRWVTARGERVTEHGDGSVVRGYLRDTTDRKRIERAPERQRDLVTGIVETVPVGVSVHNADGSILLMNERMESLGERWLEEIGGPPSDGSRYDLVDKHGEPFSHGETPLDRVVSQEISVHNRVVGVRGPSGERVWLSVSGAPQYNDGELEWTIFAFEEITERRELKNELSEVFDRISDAFFALDGEFRFTHVNRRAEKLLEASEDELIGETLWDMYPEAAELDRIWDRFHVAMDTQTPQSLELYYRPLDFWVEATIHPSESGVSVYFRDVTERKNREQELRELKSQYEALAENFPDGAVFLIDTELRYVRAGGQGLSNVGLSPDDVEGATPHDLFPEGIADETCRHYEEALDGNATTYEQTYGGERYRIQTVPVRTDGEGIEYAMAVSRNITERAENKRELERQNERLEEFTSIVSHDLRNPLQVANGRLSLVREECESDHIDDAARALDRMEALIEDLLALAREGERVDETDPVGLADVAETSWQTVDTKQAVLEIDISRAVRADQSRLRQLFENLYHNAVEHGGDDVTVSVGSMNRGFYVADTGRGIPDADRNAVFEAGYSTSDEGTGFGLRIVSQVADAHGWEVTVTESEQGGARFEFTDVEFADR